MTDVNGTLFFTANSSFHSVSEIWKTDGTAEGTTQVITIESPAGGAAPFAFTAIGDKLYFVASEQEHGAKPHRVALRTRPCRGRGARSCSFRVLAQLALSDTRALSALSRASSRTQKRRMPFVGGLLLDGAWRDRDGRGDQGLRKRPAVRQWPGVRQRQRPLWPRQRRQRRLLRGLVASRCVASAGSAQTGRIAVPLPGGRPEGYLACTVLDRSGVMI